MNTFFNDTIKIYNDDCINAINQLPDNSIDCIITDPPYFIDKLDDNWNADKLTSEKSNSHIKHLPKGMKFSKQQSLEFYKFYNEVSKLLFNKLKPGGFFLSFSSPRLYHSMAMAMDDAGFEIRDMINWVYTQSMPKGMGPARQIDRMKLTEEEKADLQTKYANMKTPQIKSCFEPICVAMKPIEKTFLENDMKYGVGMVNFAAKVGDDHGPANIVTTSEFDKVYDKNFLIKKPSKMEKGDYNNHLSVKPIALMNHLLDIFTKKGSVVLDPFLGSGSTLLSCIESNRQAIGIEKNKLYYDIAAKRIAQAEELQTAQILS
jgi:site-specific DNA-methyltransferase (adenine-specific)